ncbi:hypothetical protein GCM10027265_05740 [Jatrophihabitans fulvus]
MRARLANTVRTHIEQVRGSTMSWLTQASGTSIVTDAPSERITTLRSTTTRVADTPAVTLRTQTLRNPCEQDTG